jgi:hypothetical protein
MVRGCKNSLHRVETAGFATRIVSGDNPDAIHLRRRSETFAMHSLRGGPC